MMRSFLIMKNSFLSLRDITVIYKNPRGEDLFALNQINLDVMKGEYVAILGPSGSGKTTLSNIIGLLLNSYQGDYIFNGKVLKHLNLQQQVSLRSSEIGFIFQDYILLDHLTALENVAIALQFHHLSKKNIFELVS